MAKGRKVVLRRFLVEPLDLVFLELVVERQFYQRQEDALEGMEEPLKAELDMGMHHR
jgi:hypothetical protein